MSHPISAKHLHSIFVNDPYDSGRLNPGLPVDLYGHSLVSQNVDLHRLALRYPVVLQINQSGRRHLHGAEDRDDFQDSIVEGRRQEHIALLRASPEVCSTHEA